MKTQLATLALCVLAASCAEGGNEERPEAQVQLTAVHNIVGLIGALQFNTFPVSTDEVGPLSGRLQIGDDGRYSLSAGGSILLDDEYALETSGVFTLFQTRTQASTLVFRGAYGRDGDARALFFTDRVTSNVGLYLGVPAVAGAADVTKFAGSWHLFSTQVLFAEADTLPGIHEVGRAFVGSVSISQDGTIDGTGSESLSPTAVLPATGQLTAFDDGLIKADVNFGDTLRRFDGGASNELVIGAALDEAGDAASGLVAMLRHRVSPIDLEALAGEFEVGILTLFLNPTSAGFDSALGTMQLTAEGNFLIEARNNLGEDANFDGAFRASDTGALEMDVVRPEEVWRGAVDESGNTIVIVDNATDTAGNAPSAVRFLIAVRRAVTTE